MNNLLKFGRSLLPRELIQVLFLLGVVLISFSRELGWYSRDLVTKYGISHALQTRDARSAWFNSFLFDLMLIQFAGCVGYFLAIWKRQNPGLRVLLGIVLPAVCGLSLALSHYAVLAEPSQSVLYPGSHFWEGVRSLAIDWKLLPNGFCSTTLGTILVLVFLWRLVAGRASLPLSFAKNGNDTSAVGELPPRIQAVTFFLLSASFVTTCITSIVLIPTVSEYLKARWLNSTEYQLSLAAIVWCAVALLIAGKISASNALRTLSPPEPRFVGWSLVGAAGVGAIIPTAQYLQARAHWAAFDYGRLSPPEWVSFFSMQRAGPIIFGLAVVAVCEELVFRGVLQPIFTGRFGVEKGIVFTAAIWAGYRFHLASFSQHSLADVVLSVLGFLCGCLVLSFLCGWAAVRSGSILPAIVIHAIFNISTYFGFDSRFPGIHFVRLAIWGSAAWMLYRKWPLQPAAAISGESEAEPQPTI